jgi:hypothetical protein
LVKELLVEEPFFRGEDVELRIPLEATVEANIEPPSPAENCQK